MLSAQVYDMVAATQAKLESVAPAEVDAVRAHPPMVMFSPVMHGATAELKRFLRDKLYQHPQVVSTTERAKEVVRELFSIYLNDDAALPASVSDKPDRPRAIADYLAGMTDRYALKEHHRLTGRNLF